MCAAHSVSDTLRRANGGCPESSTRSAFNRRVSVHVHVENKSNTALNYHFVGSVALTVSPARDVKLPIQHQAAMKTLMPKIFGLI